MSSTSRYPLNGDHVRTNIINNDQQCYGGTVNVEEWLKKAKLSDYYSIFIEQKITIEELSPFTDDDLLLIATETLKMSVLHRKRFLDAMRESKQNIFSRSSPALIQCGSATQSSISASSSSSKSTINTNNNITRPLSPAHSIHSTHSLPDTKKSKTYSINRINCNNITGINDNSASTQSPLITTNYNSHRYNYRRTPLQTQILQTIPSESVSEMNGNGNNKLNKLNELNKSNTKCTKSSKKRNARFSEQRKRRHSTSETDMISDINNIANYKLIINKSTPNSLNGSSSNSINDIDELESLESSEYVDSAPNSVHSISGLKIKNNKAINKNKSKTIKTINNNNNNNNNNKNNKKNKNRRNRDKSRSNSTVTMRNKKKKMNKRKLINNKKKKKKVKFAMNGDKDNLNNDNRNYNECFLDKEDNISYTSKRSKTYDSSLTPQRQFKITRSSSKNMISATPTLTSIKHTMYSPSQISQLSHISNSYHSNANTVKSINIIISEDEEQEDSENNNNDRATITNIIGSDSNTNTNHLSHPSMPRMSLSSSGDDEQRENNDDDMSSNNDIHSDDEKWEELERNMTIEEKQNMKTISVLLQENKADSNQIENGIKILNNNYTECEGEIKEYFNRLHIKLKEKNTEILESLIKVKNDKQEILNKKILKLQENKKHILKQKYFCDQLLNNNNKNEREEKIAELKDIAMNINNKGNDDNIDNDDDDNFDINDDDIYDLKEYETKIEIDFNTKERDLFYNKICIIKQCTIPHPPKMKIKMTTFTSITLKIVIMSSKEKKAIQHHPFNNQSKNNRIHQIQIECVQSKSPDIQYIYAEFDKLNLDKNDNDNNDNIDNIDNIPWSPSRLSRRTKRKLKVKKNNGKKRRKSRKDLNDNDAESELEEEKESYSYSYSFDENNENEMNEMNEIKNIKNKRRVKRIIIDCNAKLKRIHIQTFTDLLNGHYCYIRARTKNINGWSRYCQAIHTQLPISTNLIFDTHKNNKVKYLLDNKCVVFQNTKQHNIAIINKLIDKKEYNIFEWKCTIDFDTKMADNIDNIHKQGICMGFISYPLSECMNCNNMQLGTNGTQYGLFVINNSCSAHAYFTRDGSIHHTSSITLKQKVLNGDQFKISCNMKKGKCDIYHYQRNRKQILINVFNSKIPNKIIPAISAHAINGSISCKIDFISSN